MPIDDPRQLYHNVVVMLDKAAEIGHDNRVLWPAELAQWV